MTLRPFDILRVALNKIEGRQTQAFGSESQVIQTLRVFRLDELEEVMLNLLKYEKRLHSR